VKIRATAAFDFDVPDDADLDVVRAEFESGLDHALAILASHGHPYDSFDTNAPGPRPVADGYIELDALAA